MKKHFLTAFTFAFFTFLNAQVPSYVPTNGLVGWWPFNGNANDESGNGNNGTVNGATLTADRFGAGNKAYYFSSSGCNTRIDIANFNYNGIVNEFSISFWMKRSGNGCISPRLFEFGNGSGWGVNWVNGLSTMDWVANSNLQNNNWYHVVYVLTPGTIKSYVNGVLDSQFSLTNSISSWFGSNVCFGRMNHPSYDAFNGMLDDMSAYNRALTQQEITNLYTSSVPPTCSISASASTVCSGSPVTLTNQQPLSDTVFVSSHSAGFSNAWNTTFNTDIGANYMLKISGKYTTGTYCPQLVKDAAFQLPGYYGSPNPVPVDFGCVQSGAFITANCPSNFIRPTPDVYNSNNIYRYYFTANQSSFQIGFSDNNYGDNCGNLSYELYKIVPRTYSWSPGGATTPSITISPTSTTTYTCAVTANGQSCSSSQTIEVIEPTITASSAAICAGGSATLTASSNVTSSACPMLNGSLTNGLLGYWPFCGNANDASGNGNNGTVNGATLTTDRFGNANSAYSFDGVDDYIEVTGINFGTGNQHTVSVWVNLSSALNSGFPQHYILDNGTTIGGFYLNTDVNETQFGCNSSYTNLNLGSWYHYTVVRNGNSYSLYINGQIIGNFANCSTQFLTNVSLLIGKSNINTEYANCKIDDIGIWNRVLTSTEIQQLYTQGQTTYSWLPGGATTPSITVSPNTTTTYTCTVTTNGQSCSSSQTITVNALPTVNAGSDQTVCTGTSVTLSGTGANTYSWNNGVSNGVAFTPGATTSYTVTGTDANGCSNTDQVTVNVNALPTVNAGSDQTVCAGTPVTLSGTGANTYSWNNGASNGVAFTPTSTTTFTVTGTNTATGCTNTDQVTVNVNSVSAGAIAINQTICFGGDPDVLTTTTSHTGSGTLTYQWQSSTISPTVGFTNIPGATSILYNPPAGLALTTFYQIIVNSTLNGVTCFLASNPITVTVNNVSAGAISGNQSICSGGDPIAFTTSSSATGTGVLSYQWQSSTTSPTAGFSNILGATSATYDPPAGLTSTTYYQLIVNSSLNGVICSATSPTITVTVNPIPVMNYQPDQIVCCQSSANVFFSSNLPNVNYTWTAQPNPNLSGYQLSGSGNIAPLIINNTALITQSLAYTVFPNLNGCVGLPVNFSISVLPCSIYVVPPVNQSVCSGNALNPILFTGNFTSVFWINNNWSTGLPMSGNGDIPAVNLTNGNTNPVISTIQIVAEYLGCSGNPQNVTITVYPLPSVNAGNDIVVCQNDSIILSGSGASNYQWNNAVQDGIAFIPSQTGSYVLVGSDAVTSCQNSDTVAITVNPLPTVNAGLDAAICSGDTLVLQGSGANSYTWDNNVIDGAEFSPTTTETYTVVGTDNNNCQNSDAVTVTVNDPTFSTLTESALDSYTLNGTTYTQSGVYTQVLTNAAGCDSTITLNLTLSFTGLEEMAKGIRIFPNPAQDALTIESSSALVGEYNLFDASGRIILKGNFKGKTTTIDVRNIAPGTYTLQGLELVERIVVVKGE
jgi:hypothetical protein